MKKLVTLSLSFLALASWSLQAKNTPVATPASSNNIVQQENTPSSEKLISFRFNQASLLEIIDMLAKEKGLNIVIPAGQQSITEKVTFQMPDKITVNEAWEQLLHFLRICGYSVVFQKEFVMIIKNDPKETSRQPFPLYVHTNPELIPDSDEKIRYLYYFYNLQVTGEAGGGSIVDILQAFLSKDATILIDESINGVILTDGARHIASTITLLKELDDRLIGSDGKEVITLKHTIATNIATYLQSMINPTGKQTASDISSPSVSQYFSKNIRVIPEPRTNSLILLGKKEPIARIKNFIEEFIDIKLDAGESVLHIYDLQYLDGATFKQTLSSIITSQSATSQSSGSTTGNAGQQYFKDVKIISEATQAVNPATLGSVSSTTAPANNQAGNRLIIAARRDDWLRIEKLIKELDKPQLQVAIEVLIVDLTIQEDKALGAQLRNLASISTSQNVNFQTSHLGGNSNGAFVVTPPSNATNGNQLQSDLLQSTGSDSIGNEENMASNLTAGSFILSFKDPNTNGMWLVTQMLNQYQDVKILSQPFVVALNNQACSFNSTEDRLLPGGSSVIPGGGGVQSYKESVKATLGVQLTPMISRDMRINLAIDINITEYQSTNSNVILNRKIHTNVNIKDGEILVLGGLTKTTLTKAEKSTPILSKIPIVGWLFKSKENAKTKDNLLVFISPRIIVPRTEGRFDPYTASKISNINYLFGEQNFDCNKDPVTHWFFGSDEDEITIQRVKNVGKKDLFGEDIQDDHTTSKIIIVNKHDEVPADSIQSSTTHIPSPDKTSSGMNRLIVQPPIKQKTQAELNEELIESEKNEVLEEKENTVAITNEIPRTSSGMPKIKVTPPKKGPTKMEVKTTDVLKKQDTLQKDVLKNEDANLKQLASQLKKPV